MPRRWLAPALALLVACGAGPGATSPAPAPPPPLPAAPAPRADGRLPDVVVPLSYELDLEVDPASPRFKGTERIVLDLTEASAHVVLHARGPVVSQAALVVGGERFVAHATPRPAAGGREAEELVLSFDRVVPKGRAALEIAFEAPFGDELTGLYRLERGGARYAFTQFEASEARRAFPCFDEPRWKTPYAVHVTAPPGTLALANGAEASRTARPDGRTRFSFTPTQPLPTYLVAIAVGAFEVREDPAPPGGTPIRLVAAQGKAQLGALALQRARLLLTALERYLGVRYPYGKLDLVAVPELRAGAMENAGLVTFREERLLLDPARASAHARLEQDLTIAHELAHQWFGNLVTAAWWNDLWLSEGFATFLETRAVEAVSPELGARGEALRDALHVADLDGSGAARAVRQKVTSTGDAREAFDSITYLKGAALLAQLESWTGTSVFQRALTTYLTDNAHKAVGSEAFFAALDTAAMRPVSARLARYLDEPGVPVVHLEPHCEARGRWSATLTPEAFRPLGVAMPEQPGEPWFVGVCLTTPGKPASCVDVEAGAPSMAAGAGGCPAWFFPDVDARYYRFSLPKPDLLALAKGSKKLSSAQRLALLANVWADVRAGYVDADVLPTVAEAYDGEADPHVLRELVRVLGEVDEALVDDASRPRFRAWVQKRLAKAKLPKREGASAAELPRALARGDLLVAAVDLGDDPAATATAERTARTWLDAEADGDPDLGPVALAAASRGAGADRRERLARELRGARDPLDPGPSPERRETLLRALGGFAGDGQAAALDLVLDGAVVRPHEVRTVLGTALASARTRPGARAWIERRYPELRARLPGSLGAQIFLWVGGCGEADAARVKARFAGEAATIDGAPRRLAESVEATRQCGALRDAGASTFRAALARR